MVVVAQRWFQLSIKKHCCKLQLSIDYQNEKEEKQKKQNLRSIDNDQMLNRETPNG